MCSLFQVLTINLHMISRCQGETDERGSDDFISRVQPSFSHEETQHQIPSTLTCQTDEAEQCTVTVDGRVGNDNDKPVIPAVVDRTQARINSLRQRSIYIYTHGKYHSSHLPFTRGIHANAD